MGYKDNKVSKQKYTIYMTCPICGETIKIEKENVDNNYRTSEQYAIVHNYTIKATNR